jgi:cell division septal protein FtsQ
MENPYSTRKHGSREYIALAKKNDHQLTDTESYTGDAVSDRANPRELRLVDGEMGAARAVNALLVQNLCASGSWQ